MREARKRDSASWERTRGEENDVRREGRRGRRGRVGGNGWHAVRAVSEQPTGEGVSKSVCPHYPK